MSDRLEMYLKMIRQHGSVTAAADALTASGINISKQAISAAFRRAHPNNAARIEYDKIKGKAGPKRRLYANRQECARACSKRFYDRKKKKRLEQAGKVSQEATDS